MRKQISAILILFVAFISLQGWGFYGHKKINRMAVFTLPPSMIGFYKENIEYITQHSVDPDKRRYASAKEAPRHYIDIDHYAKEGENPFDIMPRRWFDAVEKYTEDTLQAYGIVPWHVVSMTTWLSLAFEAGDVNKILSLSADLGHYIADAHVPLHTTKNYNGQLTGQKGIHGLWESRIPELVAEDYDYLVGRATYIENPLDAVWDAVEESHSHLDSVLQIEKRLTAITSSDLKYTFEDKGNTTSRQYSREFSLAYNARMGDMVENRMRKAIIMVGNLWYTAWINAGQPDLSTIGEIDEKKLSQEEEARENAFRSGKIKGRNHKH